MYNINLHYHFTGIGGSGMSGLAEILLGLGFKVSGTDLVYSQNCKRLEELGAKIFIGHSSNHLPEATSLLVYSSAVKEANPEVIEARKRNLPVIRRAEVLAELMRLKFGVAVAGSHGKTTTTSMTAQVLEVAGLDPTVIIGGVAKSLKTGGKLGRSDYLVAESDESDRSFLLLKPTIAIVTNIDLEHLESYADEHDLEESFYNFVDSIPFYGLAILCIDDERVTKIANRIKKRKLTYGFSEHADLRAEKLTPKKNHTEFSVIYHGKELGTVNLPIPGKHLVLNSLAVIAVGIEFGINFETIKKGLESFSGVERRLEILSEKTSTVINDYAHHPSEIRATISAVRDGWKGNYEKLIVVFQPHRYTRTRDCFDEFLTCFAGADQLILTDIYPASELPIENITGEILFNGIDHGDKLFVPLLDSIQSQIKIISSDKDIILFLGAGSISSVAHQYANEL